MNKVRSQMTSLKYKSLFLSDTHLGLRAARTEYLLDFLKHTESDNLYLVGDILDFWKMPIVAIGSRAVPPWRKRPTAL